MKDERGMILNMLKEGKISVEEADALLEVLAEDETDTTGAEAGPAAAPEDRAKQRDEGPRVVRIDVKDEEGGQGKSSGGKKRGFNFDLDLDLGDLKETLRDAMKGVSETVRGITEGLSDLDISGEIFRTMGKVRAEGTRELAEEAEDATNVTVSNKWGDVRVTGGNESTISVRAEVTAWGADDADARLNLDDFELHLVREGDTWVVRNALQEESATRIRVDYTIRVPRSIDVSVSTASGDIWLEELEGAQEVATLSGDISVSDIGRDTSVAQVMKTKSGDVVAGALTGDVSLSSLSGDMEINGFTGRLQVSTKSGDVTIQAGAGPVHARTLSGDLLVRLDSLGEGPVALTSVSGDIGLSIPEASAVDLSARSTSGEVDVALDLDAAERGEHVCTGSANGGGIEVSATSVSGDIQISEV
jgi:DUF4097 and DUF4098 domain-containing protein YvlB